MLEPVWTAEAVLVISTPTVPGTVVASVLIAESNPVPDLKLALQMR